MHNRPPCRRASVQGSFFKDGAVVPGTQGPGGWFPQVCRALALVPSAACM